VKDKVRAEIPSVRDVLIHIEPLRNPGEDKPAVKVEFECRHAALQRLGQAGAGAAGTRNAAARLGPPAQAFAGSDPPWRPAPLTVEPHETLDAISGHFRLFQLRDGHRFSTDDILTAWYGTSWCPTARTALDLGSGIGTVGMICAWRLPGANFVTVEAQAESVALARKSARYNGLDRPL
jgi:hypothetical protein